MVWCCGPTLSPHTAMWCCFLFQSLLVGSPRNNRGDWGGVTRIWQFSVTGSAPHPAIDSTVMTFFCKSLSVQYMPCWYNLMCVLYEQYNLMCVLYDQYNLMCVIWSVQFYVHVIWSVQFDVHVIWSVQFDVHVIW
jgi:hypothetical protein